MEKGFIVSLVIYDNCPAFSNQGHVQTLGLILACIIFRVTAPLNLNSIGLLITEGWRKLQPRSDYLRMLNEVQFDDLYNGMICQSVERLW